jgi:hypothetical protein
MGLRTLGGSVTTVYLDRPDHRLTRQAVALPAAHLKLRLREYLAGTKEPSSRSVWIELKTSEEGFSQKARFLLHKGLVDRFLAGTLDEESILACSETTLDTDPLRETVKLIREVADGPLIPVGAVTYQRFSAEGDRPRARISIDREIRFHLGPFDLYDAHAALDAAVLGPAAAEEPQAVIEVKRPGRMPDWCAAIVRGWTPTSYSKFATLASLASMEP